MPDMRSAEPVLEVRDLIKSYITPEGVHSVVIDIPHFRMDVGEFVALQGSSGCGKTTFLNLIAGILRPDRGEIAVSGERISNASEARRDRVRATSIGYVFQTFNLLQGYTALENVLLGMFFGRGADPAFAESLLKRVGLADRMNYRPRQLSVGQQQRVALARALANHPRLVLADEPTGNLDRHHADKALALMLDVCAEQNAALLVASHDRDILGQFQRVHPLAGLNRADTTGRPA